MFAGVCVCLHVWFVVYLLVFDGTMSVRFGVFACVRGCLCVFVRVRFMCCVFLSVFVFLVTERLFVYLRVCVGVSETLTF